MNNYILSSQYGSKEKKLSSYLSKMRKKHIIECFERCLFFLGKNPISLVYSFGLRVTKSKIINPSGDLSLMQERLITNLLRSFYFDYMLRFVFQFLLKSFCRQRRLEDETAVYCGS